MKTAWVPFGMDPAAAAAMVPHGADGVYVGQAVIPMAGFLARYAASGHDLSREVVASAEVIAANRALEPRHFWWHLPDGRTQDEPGPYDDGGHIRQAYTPLPRFGDVHAVVGAWMVGDAPAGMGIREDVGYITRDTARFVPHVIVNE